ncbi:MAG TPA: dipeptide epimerase [Verrucomicrobiae bacterium]|nr:dipeptide epimerase [Verrucomicrobiae bacterium]
MNFDAVIHPLHPRSPFRVSHGDRSEVRNVFVRVRDAGITGCGEASPNAVYGESSDSVLARLHHAADWLCGQVVRSASDIGRIWAESWPMLAPSRAAQCAMDLALWDWLGHLEGRSVAELALGAKPHPVPTFCTIGLSTPEELERKVSELRSCPLIKIKSDAAADLSTVRFVRARTTARLAVDANCAWGGANIPALSQELAALGVAFIEQPLPPSQHARMPAILAASALPILADESCVATEDVERMPGHFSGFNIKLVKCGGLTPALGMLRRGRELGLRLMVGCMLESSLLISAGAVVAQQTDFADLDGAWLLRDDPFAGPRLEGGTLHLPDTPGLGAGSTTLVWDPPNPASPLETPESQPGSPSPRPRGIP